MGSIPGVNHLQAIRALERAGFRILRQSRHVVMTDGTRLITVPRSNPINAFTMAGIVRDAGLTEEKFRQLLERSFVAARGLGGQPPARPHEHLRSR